MRTGKELPSLNADPPIWLFLVTVSASWMVPLIAFSFQAQKASCLTYEEVSAT